MKKTVVSKNRRLTPDSQILVSEGQSVSPSTPISKHFLPLPRQFFLVSSRVLSGGNSFGYRIEWHVNSGDNVEYKAPLLTYWILPEFSAKIVFPDGETLPNPRQRVTYYSPIEGTVLEVLEKSGNILIRESVDYENREAVIDLDNIASLKGRALSRSLKFRVGDFVEKGQLIIPMDRTSLRPIKSPLSGNISDIQISRGIIVISRDFEEVIQHSGLSGKVTSIDRGNICIEGEGNVCYGVCGLGREAFGELTVFLRSADRVVIPEELNQSHKGKIIVGGSLLTIDLLRKAAQVGIAGYISGGANHRELAEFIGRDFSVSSTGGEDIPFPIILTEGFGKNSINADYYSFFEAKNGLFANISGKTHIRAGVIRPEIFVQG